MARNYRASSKDSKLKPTAPHLIEHETASGSESHTRRQSSVSRPTMPNEAHMLALFPLASVLLRATSEIEQGDYLNGILTVAAAGGVGLIIVVAYSAYPLLFQLIR